MNRKAASCIIIHSFCGFFLRGRGAFWVRLPDRRALFQFRQLVLLADERARVVINCRHIGMNMNWNSRMTEALASSPRYVLVQGSMSEYLRGQSASARRRVR